MTSKLPTIRGSGASSSPTAPGAGVRVPHGPVVLDRYRLHRRLGTGGFATVWLARDERLERDVAVKILPRERVVGGRFEREARAAARLSHVAIVTLYEAAVDDEGAYLVSELVRGATLGELLQAGQLSDRDVVSIGIKICEALAHAHAHGVVHRDVKPSNVLVADRPSPETAPIAKLTDFGVARVIGGDLLTRTGDVIGTAAYMAPEQAEGREADAAADLYSLSLVLYEALSGVNPIRITAGAQRARRLGAHPPPLRRQRRDLPRELGRAIDQALRPRPRERGTVDELRASLVACIGELEDTAGVVTGPWPRLGGRSEPWRVSSTPRKQSATVSGGGSDRAAPSWYDRAVAGAVAGGLAAWISAAPFTGAPLAPAAAGTTAAIAVAAMPRMGWLALAVLATGWLAGRGAAGAALVVALAAVMPVALLLRHPVRWPLAALAPALGLAGLAGAWPAIAGRAPSAWQRAGLAATGWIWLVLAAPLAGVAGYVQGGSAALSRSQWLSSPYDAANHLLAPLLRSGVLAPAVVWVVAAVALPSVTKPRRFRVRLATVAAWAVATVVGIDITLKALQSAGSVELGAAALGSLGAGFVALSPMPRLSHPGAVQPPDIEAGLA